MGGNYQIVRGTKTEKIPFQRSCSSPETDCDTPFQPLSIGQNLLRILIENGQTKITDDFNHCSTIIFRETN